MRVYLCEKPSQGHDIARFVGATQRGNGFMSGPGVIVTWNKGHMLKQAPPEHYSPELRLWNLERLPVLPGTWTMQVLPKTKDQFAVVQAQLRRATEVVLATDADREGEVIGWEILEYVGYKGPVRRLWLSALNDPSIKKGLANLLPKEAKLPLYYSGLGRARADWLAGMNLTMALTAGFSTGRGDVKHCGRVQTPTLALVVRRERAIRDFKPKTHYQLAAHFEMHGTVVPMNWLIPQERLDAEGHCVDQAFVSAVAKKISGQVGRLSDVTTTAERELAPLPYSLGALQREASARYGLKAQTVLDAAQELYEKHKATTYARTDCEYLPQSMFSEAAEVLQALARNDAGLSKLVAAADLNRASRAFNDEKFSGHGHFAIIPTANPTVRLGSMSNIERLIYDLVRRRYLAQFLGDFHFDKTVIRLVCQNEQFSKTGRTPTSQGWKRAYEGMESTKPTKATANKGPDADGGDDASVVLPPVRVNDQAINRKADCVKTQTKPPKRYTDGTLLAAMDSIDKAIEDPRLRRVMQNKEKAGIGTDATRASTIDGLVKREYLAYEKKALVPTPRGESLITLIEGIAPQMADPVLTALWEDRLSQIESGQLTLAQFEAELARWLGALMQKIREQAVPRAARAPAGPHDAHGGQGPVHPCPSCGRPLRARNGSSGPFWGCSGYPECKTTLPDECGAPGARVPREEAARAAVPAAGAGSGARTGAGGAPGAVQCSCGKPMRLRQSSRGPFYGCSGYPECRNTMPAGPGPGQMPGGREAGQPSHSPRH